MPYVIGKEHSEQILALDNPSRHLFPGIDGKLNASVVADPLRGHGIGVLLNRKHSESHWSKLLLSKTRSP